MLSVLLTPGKKVLLASSSEEETEAQGVEGICSRPRWEGEHFNLPKAQLSQLVQPFFSNQRVWVWPPRTSQAVTSN